MSRVSDEATRLDILEQYDILDTPQEIVFDDLAFLASQICNVETGLVSFIDQSRQWFKARVNFDFAETPRRIAFCSHTIESDDVLVVEDALSDERFQENPLVTGDPSIRFYAGAPLITREGSALGTLCVIGYEPNRLSSEQSRALQILARQVVAHLDYRRAMTEVARVFVLDLTLDGRVQRLSSSARSILGYENSNLLEMAPLQLVHPQDRRRILAFYRKILKQGALETVTARLLRSDGDYAWFECSALLVADGDLDDGSELQIAIQDVDQRVKAQREIEEMRGLLENSREKERLHLAQELHDAPIQELFAVQMSLKALANSIPETARHRLEEVTHQLIGVADGLRNLCNDLRPPVLEHFGLNAALATLVQNFRRKNQDTNLFADIEEEMATLTQAQELALYRVCQQSLSNIEQHAQARNVSVRLFQSRQVIILEIKDDGVGFKLPTRWLDLAREQHFGLVGSMERIQAAGGQYTVRSSPGEGTLIRIHLPIDSSWEKDRPELYERAPRVSASK